MAVRAGRCWSSAAVRGCRAGQKVRVAGLVAAHQAPPTAHGVHFVTLDDEAGLVDVIVHPQVYAQYPHVLRSAPALVVEGVVQQHDGVVNVLARRVARLG
ncbi:MAG: hypothetical protein M5R40_06670 [Anaerolineae bacterium]|nr:hypothetical protein [Anaerolineae bacterium]